MKIYNIVKVTALTLGIALSIFAINFVVLANWTPPPATPPTCPVGSPGCDAPVHVGTSTQAKVGAFGVGGVFQTNSATHLATGGGNVGIGTTAPGYRLDVSGEITSRQMNAFRLRQPNFGLIFRNDNVDTWMLLTNNLDPDGGWNALRPFRINNATGNVHLGNHSLNVVHSSGNVGIGTTTPGRRLSVVGDVELTGFLTVEGNSNLCQLVTFTATSGTTPCPAGYFTSTSLAGTSGTMLCCKVSNPI